MTEKMRTLILFFSILFHLLGAIALSQDQQIYIVYLGEHKGDKLAHEIEDKHNSYLLSVKNSVEEARASLLYSYKNSINGFAAVITSDEAAKLSELEEVVAVFPSNPTTYSLQTSRSWEFIEFLEKAPSWSKKSYTKRAKYGKDVIVGLLDSGVWPESKSFSDEGFGPVPISWKGICQEGDSFNSSHCNKKLIGARYYLKGYETYYGRLNTTAEFRSPRDHDGHGTHTTSTVGGRVVHHVSAIGGFAYGTVQGGAPMARLAMYKVCWPKPSADPSGENTCLGADMLAAMDDAIADGVNVLSISIGATGYPPNYYTFDAISMGALHATKKDVVVVCSAGNSGPKPSTASNLAPWILTVAASSVDRIFPSPVILGNGKEIEAQSVAPLKLKEEFYPLVYAGHVEVAGTLQNASGQCLPNSLDPKKMKGKIVLCLRGQGTRVGKGMEVKRAGGAAIILGNSLMNGQEVSVDAYVLPGTAVSVDNMLAILAYINSTSNPTAMIIPGKTILHYKPSPSMAGFSSTGPNPIEPNIIKPDITGPGINILAAWSEASSPTKLAGDTRRVKYNLLSGTSMSCPHVAAAAALLRAIHPNWSAAAIRSALMTTATTKNKLGLPIATAAGNVSGPFNYGSGHVQPIYAAEPGLVYDTSYTEFLLFLCGRGFNMDPSFTCPNTSTILPWNLNYPSIAVAAVNGTVTVKRTVTNVGFPISIYRVYVVPPVGFSVKVAPSVLYFSREGEKKNFEVTITAEGTIAQGEYRFGWFVWSDGFYFVRSPIVASTG